jgi:hypothetical protein
MATRQLIPIDKCTKCHVNSVDGSMEFELGVDYEAGEVVTENTKIYLPISALSASRVGIPSETPAQWARVSGSIQGEV